MMKKSVLKKLKTIFNGNLCDILTDSETCKNFNENEG